MLRIYRGLLQLYPAAYRREFMKEILWVCREAEKDLIGLPFTARAVFYAGEIFGFVSGAAREHVMNLCGVNPFSPFGRRAMSPQFRFPSSTIWLMLVILGGVILAIEEAKSIQLKFDAGAKMMSVWSSLPGFATWTLALVCIAGSAGWAILFALGRSGAHRLSKLPTGTGADIKNRS